jgi:hypothetical protein
MRRVETAAMVSSDVAAGVSRSQGGRVAAPWGGLWGLRARATTPTIIRPGLCGREFGFCLGRMMLGVQHLPIPGF